MELLIYYHTDGWFGVLKSLFGGKIKSHVLEVKRLFLTKRSLVNFFVYLLMNVTISKAYKKMVKKINMSVSRL